MRNFAGTNFLRSILGQRGVSEPAKGVQVFGMHMFTGKVTIKQQNPLSP